MERFVVMLGDLTNQGGRVLKCSGTTFYTTTPVARLGDPVSCPVCGIQGRIAEGNPTVLVDNLPLAGQFHRVDCGCPPGTHWLETTQREFSIGDAVEGAHASCHWRFPDSTPAPEAALSIATTAMTATAEPGKNDYDASDELEEEEEIEEGQLITLRLGVFFDGTGNNQSNSESVAGCRASDVELQDLAPDIRQLCVERGYNGNGQTPDDSYGNDTTNVARLYDLYEDQADEQLEPDSDKVSLKVYLEGVGTVSGGTDSLYSQGTGLGKTGVLARVRQAPILMSERLIKFVSDNPGIKIQRIEVDVFGFSRGAAAARHFANDLLKGPNSLLAAAMPAGSSAFVQRFKWRAGRDILINFIGLFDTVPAIVSPLKGDFSPGNAVNQGLNLGLAANAARKIVQLVARDEHRLNFALIRSVNDIVLPGAHSDLGGGYLPVARERLLLSKPFSSLEPLRSQNKDSVANRSIYHLESTWLRQLLAQGLDLRNEQWAFEQPRTRDQLRPEKRVYAAVSIDREVRGDLSKVYLRIMRELGVKHGVPFDTISDQDSRLSLPAELMPIARKLQAYALGHSPALDLTQAEESLLMRRYIHLSANWNAAKGFSTSDLDVLFLNRPAENEQRVIHANQ